MDPRALRRPLLELAALSKDAADSAVLAVKRATGLLRSVRARPYAGHGTPTLVHVKGRVGERSGVDAAQRTDSRLANVVAIARRFTATPVPDAPVRLRLGTAEAVVTSDRDGYFRAELRPDTPLAAGWHEVTAELLLPEGESEACSARVLVPAAGAEFGIVSDLDDTVLRSGITRPLQALLTVLLNNAATRTPFQGVADLYRALQHGPDGAGTNPLFYVSSSPWNLHDLVEEFLRVHDVPAGPLFLRAWGLDADAQDDGGHAGHKSALLEGLLDTYPDLRFVLIGDSGQQDPEIYRDLALAHPDRVLAVYVRDVTDPARDAQVQAVAEQVRAAGVPFALVADSAAAAADAAARRLVAPARPDPGPATRATAARPSA